MNDEEIFSRWYAAAGPWAACIKPSLLSESCESENDASLDTPADAAELPAANDTALVLDLPGRQAVAYGVALASRGYCPVPMFNTTSGTGERVPTDALKRALRRGAGALTQRADGPPAFLLDAQRQSSQGMFLDYDNTWYVFASDFPPEERLVAAGIKRLVIVSLFEPGADLLDALAAHAGLDRSLFNLVSRATAPFPRSRPALVRTMSGFVRTLSKNLDGTFGHRVSHHG